MKKYLSYKETGVSWIGEIPAHWEIKRLKGLAEETKLSFIDGDWIESKDLSENGIRYITTGNIGSGFYKEQGGGFISEETFAKLNCTELFPGDIIISRLFSPVGRSCILPDLGQRVITSVDNVIFIPKSNLSKHYLNYYFNWVRYNEFNDLCSRGTTLNRISRSMLGNNPVIVPPYEEQLRIVEYLDDKTKAINSLLDKKQKLISLLQEERTALINIAVTKGIDPNAKMKDSEVEWIGEVPETWQVLRTKFISETISKGTTPSTEGKEILPSGEIKFIKAENIRNDQLCHDPYFFIDEKTNLVLKRSILNENDVLIVIAGATIGKVAIVTDEFVPANTNQAVCFIRPKDSEDSNWIWYWLQSSLIKEQINIESVQSAQPNLSMEKIGNFYLPYPTKKEQKAICKSLNNSLEKLDKVIVKIENEIALLTEYKTSLINEVITGKICVLPDENKSKKANELIKA